MKKFYAEPLARNVNITLTTGGRRNGRGDYKVLTGPSSTK